MSTPLRDLSKMSQTERGYFVAFAATLTAALMTLTNRLVVAEMGADPWGIAFLQTIMGGVILFLMGGGLKRTGTGLATLKNKMTWLIGAIRVLHVLSVIFSLQILTATEVCFLVSMHIPIGVTMAWIFSDRPPKKTQIPGLILTCIGLIWMVILTDGGFANTGVLFVVGMAFLWALEAFLIEHHPEIKETGGHKDRFRATGIVLMVTGVSFLGLSLIVSGFPFVQSSLGKQGEHLIPHLDLLLQPHTLISGVLIGFIFRGPRMYLEYLAIKIMKSENYFMAFTLQPFAVLAVEGLLSWLGYTNMGGFDTWNFIAGTVVTGGAMMMLVARIKAEHRDMEKEAWEKDPLFGDNPFFKPPRK